MTASLIKKVFLPLDTAAPIPVMTNTLSYHEEIKCSHCEQVYTLGLPSAQDRLFIWRIKAQDEVNKSHDDGHDVLSLPIFIPTMEQQREYTRLSGLLQQICIHYGKELPPGTVSVVLTANNKTIRLECYAGSKSIGVIPNAATSTFFLQDLLRAFSHQNLPEDGVIAIVSNTMSAKGI